MAFSFPEKLDFLMKLSNTPNSSLARILNFDASYISRIRSGKRGIPRHTTFIDAVSAYFARTITEPYQTRAAADAILPGMDWPEDTDEAKVLIACWLTQDNAPRPNGIVRKSNLWTDDPVAHFLQGVSLVTQKHSSTPPAASTKPAPLQFQCFYGNEGKRSCVEAMLRELIFDGGQYELMLFSEENMAWIYEDAAFLERWRQLLRELLDSGSRIRIIHTVNRNPQEMLEAIRSWLPVYVSGRIEPWYYPGRRDAVFRRTMFLAGGLSAMVSSSVGEHTEGTLSLLLHSPDAVKSLEREFLRYLSLCSPLMKIERLSDSAQVPPLLASLSDAELYLYFPFPEPRDAAGADSLRDCFREAVQYGREDQDCEVLYDEALPDNLMIALSRTGVLVLRADEPKLYFLIRESHLVSAFHDYLHRRETGAGRRNVDFQP